ncbi:LAMI_0A02366g1_1 [Lachancea mirantina]|uniref:LAMI_0A02366g1_1 n=1 Tax=Lachancea mirantina TaxID=1230905 RepID=A0A1G4IMG9_9SACH|nr:LAMI_0A02366g1_1 [Lachancea mirantina]
MFERANRNVWRRTVPLCHQTCKLDDDGINFYESLFLFEFRGSSCGFYRSGLTAHHQPSNIPMRLSLRALQTGAKNAGNTAPVSPHALLYRRWGKLTMKSVALCVGTYYSLYWLWELLERGERKREKTFTGHRS